MSVSTGCSVNGSVSKPKTRASLRERGMESCGDSSWPVPSRPNSQNGSVRRWNVATHVRFSENCIPLYGEVALEDLGAPFDVLVMDEAQDLSDQHALDFFNLAIRGCLVGGRWAIFGDFTRQVLYSSNQEPVATLSCYSEHFVRAKLTLNCRSTRRIVGETTILAGFETPPFRLGDEMGLPVEHRYWNTPADLVESLTNVVERLVKEKMSINDIVLLSPSRLENSSLARIERISRFPIADCSRGMSRVQSTAVRFSTIHSLQGTRKPSCDRCGRGRSRWRRAAIASVCGDVQGSKPTHSHVQRACSPLG